MRLSAENTAVVLDSTADLPDPAARHANWRLVPLYVRFGDETFRDHVDLSAEEFYRRLRAAAVQPTTSQPTPADFAAAFAGLAGYERIVCLTISSKLSGTYESARLGASEAGEGKVTVFDSASASGGIVILAEAIQRRLERGTSDEEIAELVGQFREKSGLLFTVDTLDFLVRGGRVGKAAGLAGELLSVKPILTIAEGEVRPLKRVRGRRKALAELARLLEERTEDDPRYRLGVAHAHAQADADALVARARAVRPRCALEVFLTLGPVIGTHGGPGTLGLFWFRDPD